MAIDKIVFSFVFVTVLMGTAYQFGFDGGFEKGRSTANGVCKIVCERR